MDETFNLQRLCLECIIQNWNLLSSIEHLHLPVRIYPMLLTTAFRLYKRYSRVTGMAMTCLVSHWPSESFVIKDVLPPEKGVLTSDEQYQALRHVMEGLLTLHSTSSLRVIDFRGFYMPLIFQLPLLAIPKEERLSDAVLNEIQNVCQTYIENQDQDHLLPVLSWKLKELSKEPSYHCTCKGPIEVYVESQMNLAEWIAVVDEMLALILQHRTPFRIRICRLAVENFNLQQLAVLRWLFSTVDKLKLYSLGIYGKRKSITMVIWHFHDQLVEFTELRIFALASVGPPLIKNLDGSGPTEEQLLQRTHQVFKSWTHLEEVYFNRIHISNQVEMMLSALQTPLKLMFFYAAELRQKDMAYIATSHHIHNLTSLTIEKNKLRGMGEELCQLAENATCIETLNLKDAELQLHEKVHLLSRLQLSQSLKVLVLHESEDMVSTDGYEQMTELACAIRNLTDFYIFPFCYKPFEIFYRQKAQERCEAILLANDRTDIVLYY